MHLASQLAPVSALLVLAKSVCSIPLSGASTSFSLSKRDDYKEPTWDSAPGPYHRFILAGSGDAVDNQKVLDIGFCVQNGVKNEKTVLQWHFRKGISPDDQKKCQVFQLDKLPGGDKRFGLRISDSDSNRGIYVNTGTGVARADAIYRAWWHTDQQFVFYCLAPAQQAGDEATAYLGFQCKVKNVGNNKCMAADAATDNKADHGTISWKDCITNADLNSGQLWNIQNVGNMPIDFAWDSEK